VIMKSVLSSALSCVPFCAHDDGNRLQMAANFLRQSLVLVNPQLPYISTPYLQEVTKLTTFLKQAAEDIQILYRNEEIVVYKSLTTGKVYLYRIPSSLWSVSVQDTVKEGEVFAQHTAVKFDRYCAGTNLKVVFAPYEGWNYEDAIVVSESGAQKLTSQYVKSFELILEPNEVLMKYPIVGRFYKKGEILFEWTSAPKNPINVLCTSVDKRRIFADTDLVIERVSTYYKSEKYLDLHKSSPTVLKWIKEHNKPKAVKTLLSSIDPSIAKVTSLYFPESYELVGNQDAIVIVAQAKIVRSFCVGDKLGNRHGNKGVCSIIVPDRYVTSKDGWVPDLVLNPLGVISRMNIGQIFEMHLGEVCRVVEEKVRELVEFEKYDEAFKLLQSIEKITKGTIPYLHLKLSVKERLTLLLEFGFTLELPLYTRSPKEMIRKCMKLLGVSPTKVWRIGALERDFGYGTMYFMALVHTVESKFSTRADGPYHIKTLQPCDDECHSSGQRLGEMEIWNLLAYGAVHNVVETLGFKADDIIAKENMISHCLKVGEPPVAPDSVYTNHSLYLYLYALGVNVGGVSVLSDTDVAQKCLEWGDL